MQQTFPSLSPQPYKHQKTTKLKSKTLWMKNNYKNIINIDYYCFLPCMNHYRFMKSNTFVNCSVRLTLLDSWSQFFTSHATSIIMHIHNRWIESSLINLHHSPFVMLHLEAQFPRPKHWDPTSIIITLKLIWPKLVLGMVDIVLQ